MDDYCDGPARVILKSRPGPSQSMGCVGERSGRPCSRGHHGRGDEGSEEDWDTPSGEEIVPYRRSWGCDTKGNLARPWWTCVDKDSRVPFWQADTLSSCGRGGMMAGQGVIELATRKV